MKNLYSFWDLLKINSVYICVFLKMYSFLSLCVWQEVYSKRMVSLGSVDKVVSVGDLRFELHSQSRTFLFRAESTRAYLTMFSPDHLAEYLWHIFVFTFRLWMIFIHFILRVYFHRGKKWLGVLPWKDSEWSQK